MKKYIAVDFDGVLAHQLTNDCPKRIGQPVRPMIQRVKRWLLEGYTVKIFTGRPKWSWPAVRKFCKEHLGRVLPITNKKDRWMAAIYDDRAVHVERNTGVIR